MMRTLVVAVLFIGLSLCFEKDVSLFNSQKVKIISEFASLPISVRRDYSVERGSVNVVVGSLAVNLESSDVYSRLHGDTVEIILSGFYPSSYYESSSNISSASFLNPVNAIVLLIFGFLFTDILLVTKI